jgi:hypothetical protein
MGHSTDSHKEEQEGRVEERKGGREGEREDNACLQDMD